MALKLAKIEIENFRSFHEVQFNIGQRITAICGQNGVGKSNIVSLIASGSGQNKKGELGSNFQPEFYDFFNIEKTEHFTKYKLFLTYKDKNNGTVRKRLSFKDDSQTNRGIRIIPRTDNKEMPSVGIREAERIAKEKYGVGGSARIPIPTIYLSISRLYPLGERRETVTIKELKKKNKFNQNEADTKFRNWYNSVIPNSIKSDASLSIIEKIASSRSSLHMDMERTPTLSQSVGQDNLGNIISALVDIYLLSRQDDYAGAILCIDEVAVSLHPDTQIRLLDLLDQLSDELKIQVVVSTHSLTIIKELLKKQKKHPKEYAVVYLKNPSAPMVTMHKTYEILKADMLGRTTFDTLKTKVYFEDEVGQHLFALLVASLRHQLNLNSERRERTTENNQIYEKLINLEEFSKIHPNLNEIVMNLGCDELIKISSKDPSYFQRVVFVLDGDARYKEPAQKPRVEKFLDKPFDSRGQSERAHKENVCFLPGPFAPESFLYQIIYYLMENETSHNVFWRTLDQNEETALYTATKIRNMFSELPKKFNNEDLKNIFKTYKLNDKNSEIWNFIDKSHLLDYYYSDCKKIGELIDFFERFKKAFTIAHAKTVENRYG